MTHQITFLFSFFVAAYAAISDVKSRKISNSFLLVAFVSGVFLKIFQKELVYGLMTCFVTFFILLIPYMFGAFGAADIKLLMVIGLICGRDRIEKIIIISLLVGVVIGLIKITINVVKKESIKGITIPYAAAIFIAHLVVYVFEK